MVADRDRCHTRAVPSELDAKGEVSHVLEECTYDELELLCAAALEDGATGGVHRVELWQFEIVIDRVGGRVVLRADLDTSAGGGAEVSLRELVDMVRAEMSRRSTRSSVELVDLAIASHGRSKEVRRALEMGPPDEAAALRVREAFAAGRAPPWLAAMLLGGIRHERGYSLALEILAGGHGSLSEEYAATAIVCIASPAAERDLVRVFESAIGPERSATRRAASWALGALRTPSATNAVLDALARGHIRALTAARALAGAPLDPALLTDWLRTGRRDVERVFVGMLIAQRCSASVGRGARAELARCDVPELVAALRAEIADVSSPMWMRDRDTVARWLDSLA